VDKKGYATAITDLTPVINNGLIRNYGIKGGVLTPKVSQTKSVHLEGVFQDLSKHVKKHSTLDIPMANGRFSKSICLNFINQCHHHFIIITTNTHQPTTHH
jgi:hypothetical protein